MAGDEEQQNMRCILSSERVRELADISLKKKRILGMNLFEKMKCKDTRSYITRIVGFNEDTWGPGVLEMVSLGNYHEGKWWVEQQSWPFVKVKNGKAKVMDKSST